MAWYDEQKFATSNIKYSIRKFSSVSKVTGRHTRPMGYAAFAGHNPVEGFVTSSHLAEVELHHAQCLCEDDVQAATSINEGLMQPGPIDYGVDDQRISSRVGDVDPMIFPGESDWEFRPPQRPRVFGVDVPDIPSV
jgi:hypothetical protein